MDRVIEKTKSQRLMKYWPYMAGGCLVLVISGWLIFGNHASTLRVSKDELSISEVRQAEFKDYVRTNGQVLPIQVVQISPEEGGIVMEKVVEEGTMVHKGDVIYADRKVNAYTHVESDVIGIPLNPVDDIAEFVDWQLHKILLGGEPEELKSVEQKLLDKLGGEVDIYFSAPWFLEVMPKGINKGIGIEKICDHMGISTDEVIAFGDSFNDISMIRTAGVGVAMGNAEQELKDCADYITDDCDSDGIAKALEYFNVV